MRKCCGRCIVTSTKTNENYVIQDIFSSRATLDAFIPRVTTAWSQVSTWFGQKTSGNTVKLLYYIDMYLYFGLLLIYKGDVDAMTLKCGAENLKIKNDGKCPGLTGMTVSASAFRQWVLGRLSKGIIIHSFVCPAR